MQGGAGQGSRDRAAQGERREMRLCAIAAAWALGVALGAPGAQGAQLAAAIQGALADAQRDEQARDGSAQPVLRISVSGAASPSAERVAASLNAVKGLLVGLHKGEYSVTSGYTEAFGQLGRGAADLSDSSANVRQQFDVFSALGDRIAKTLTQKLTYLISEVRGIVHDALEATDAQNKTAVATDIARLSGLIQNLQAGYRALLEEWKSAIAGMELAVKTCQAECKPDAVEAPDNSSGLQTMTLALSKMKKLDDITYKTWTEALKAIKTALRQSIKLSEAL